MLINLKELRLKEKLILLSQGSVLLKEKNQCYDLKITTPKRLSNATFMRKQVFQPLHIYSFNIF
jgi:hypothetical protein